MKLNMNLKFRYLMLYLIFALSLIFSACGQHESSSAISPDAIQVTFKVLEAPVSGMKANLTISGMTGPNSDGSYPMTVNADGSVTATMSGVPAGTHTFTITYYDASGLAIAQATTSGNVTAGTNTNVSISQGQVNTSFDADGDGFTNLDEDRAGSNPKDPASRPAATTFTLTVTKAGTGTGTVTSSPAGISCGADCSEPYNSGTVVTLTAAPAAGSTFAGWSGGGCSGTGTCSVTMNAATAVTATLNLADTTPPTVLSTNPVNGAKSVAVDTLITANFSKLMDKTTITSATFTLTSAAGPVTGTVSYAGNTATFTLSSNLATLTTYTATITTGVKDLAGNPMAANFTWSFTTSAGPASFGPVTFFAVGTNPWHIAIGDLNMDGKPDLAVANFGSNNVSILLNQPASPLAKATILADPGGEQVVSSKDDSHSAFGCGSIDIKGSGPKGPSGPPDMGGMASFLAILSLPFILRWWWRNYRRNYFRC